MQPLFDFLGQFTGGAGNAFVITAAILKIALFLGGVLTAVPFIIVFERKILSWIQDRPGPNRVGPFGLLQGFMDGLKLFLKEEIMPKGVDKTLFLLAPTLVVIPAFLALCIVPFGPIIQGEHLDALGSFLGLDPAMVGSGGEISQVALAVTNPNIGILYLLAITSVGVYGITLAGWSSNNKWSLLGGIRASAQMISYEITLSLAVIGVVLLAGSLNLYDIIEGQRGGFWHWNVVAQPVAILLFIVAMFAETNRLPFDLAEAESELTGGFHTEYSSMRFALFFMSEYVSMIVISAACATLFLGGFFGPIPLPWETLMEQFGLVAILAFYIVGPLVILPAKVSFFLFLFIFARGALPRLRYDQLMTLGWKYMLPIGIINLVVTACGVAIDMAITRDGEVAWVTKVSIGAVTLVLFLGWELLIFSRRRRSQLSREYRNLYRKESSSDPALAS